MRFSHAKPRPVLHSVQHGVQAQYRPLSPNTLSSAHQLSRVTAKWSTAMCAAASADLDWPGVPYGLHEPDRVGTAHAARMADGQVAEHAALLEFGSEKEVVDRVPTSHVRETELILAVQDGSRLAADLLVDSEERNDDVHPVFHPLVMVAHDAVVVILPVAFVPMVAVVFIEEGGLGTELDRLLKHPNLLVHLLSDLARQTKEREGLLQRLRSVSYSQSITCSHI